MEQDVQLPTSSNFVSSSHKMFSQKSSGSSRCLFGQSDKGRCDVFDQDGEPSEAFFVSLLSHELRP